MTFNGWLQILVFFGVVVALTRPIGVYMFRVFEGDRPWPRLFGPIERGLLKLCGVGEKREQTWRGYAFAMLVFSAIGVLVTYGIERYQAVLPLNPHPARLKAVPEDLAFNTAASFTTNTNWQAYSGESTMSYFTQMVGLAWHNFMSAAVGIGVALVIARGLTRKPSADGAKLVGNFWVDVIHSTVYVLLPLSVVAALLFAGQGVIQNFDKYPAITTLEGGQQTLAMGPVASQEAIKELGTNGGGFFNANSAHPFENPTPATNFLQLVLIFLIPAGLTYTFGRMARDQLQGWTIFGAMAVLFFVGVTTAYWAESKPNQALADLKGIDQSAGNMEGKETRFGITNSALFATVTTDASCGAVNSMHDSFNPLGGLVPLVNIQLGEVIFGGVGAGLYGILIFVLLSVFIAGLMVGRTPEYLGKKIESREIKLAMLYVLIFPFIILGMSAWSAVYESQAAQFAKDHPAPATPTADAAASAAADAVTPTPVTAAPAPVVAWEDVVTPDAPPTPAPNNLYGASALNNSGPHGVSEMIYAYTSGCGNNGSAFAGLNANTPWWNITLGVVMLAGRFLMIVPVLAIAGSMVNKKTVAPGLGTFPTNSLLFTVLLVSVVVIVGALTFFPALCLGPVIEHFLGLQHKLY